MVSAGENVEVTLPRNAVELNAFVVPTPPNGKIKTTAWFYFCRWKNTWKCLRDSFHIVELFSVLCYFCSRKATVILTPESQCAFTLVRACLKEDCMPFTAKISYLELNP